MPHRRAGFNMTRPFSIPPEKRRSRNPYERVVAHAEIGQKKAVEEVWPDWDRQVAW
jgi:hypothetical protein